MGSRKEGMDGLTKIPLLKEQSKGNDNGGLIGGPSHSKGETLPIYRT